MNDYDYDYDFDDDWVDPNFSLPWYFLSRLAVDQVPVFEAAMQRYAEIDPEHGLEIDHHSVWNGLPGPALLRGKRGADLSEFWRIVDQVREELRSNTV